MTAAPPEVGNPWQRWGWLLAAVWLVFLVFPIIDVIGTDRPWPVRWGALASIAAFVAVYLHGFIVAERPTARSHRWWRPTVGLVLLTLLTTITVALIGANALGMPIYVTAYAVLLASLRVAAFVVVTATGVIAGLAAFVDEFRGLWFFLPVLVGVTLALVLTRVFEERGYLAQEMAEEANLVAERERVARDVHDVLGHSLTVVTTKAELAERLIDLDPDRAKAELAQIQSLSREALTEIRATVAGLRVARLGDELEAARVALASAGIDADVPDDPSVVDPRRRLVLAWVLREAVTNVVRHSGATRCTVELLGDRLVVTDDGRGRGPAPVGHGLRGIEERVRAAGGTLSVTDVSSGGTRLEVCWQ
ncbi:two-component system sensor histidine kinase DesK [Nocardioides massiliensis]|uniref:Two-component system sensor histidine kinase DesK n=2 Tax=Nocardioides massiliensis TaxID=1325935 RepID=A0ABT9NIJ7_9ACTN|nr:sensor histidine kinase [Nocardioides massiliensis]MDP9820238.1 two-component system sensor histidine kinase DesK [Nocardioides massiliensis]